MKGGASPSKAKRDGKWGDRQIDQHVQGSTSTRLKCQALNGPLLSFPSFCSMLIPGLSPVYTKTRNHSQPSPYSLTSNLHLGIIRALNRILSLSPFSDRERLTFPEYCACCAHLSANSISLPLFSFPLGLPLLPASWTGPLRDVAFASFHQHYGGILGAEARERLKEPTHSHNITLVPKRTLQNQ